MNVVLRRDIHSEKKKQPLHTPRINNEIMNGLNDGKAMKNYKKKKTTTTISQ